MISSSRKGTTNDVARRVRTIGRVRGVRCAEMYCHKSAVAWTSYHGEHEIYARIGEPSTTWVRVPLCFAHLDAAGGPRNEAQLRMRITADRQACSRTASRRGASRGTR